MPSAHTNKIPKHCTDAEGHKADVSKSRESCADKADKREGRGGMKENAGHNI